MNGINGYQIYQKNYAQSMAYTDAYEKNTASKQNADVEQTKDAFDNNSVSEVKKEKVTLSDNAKSLLERLKQTYTNMDFMVANYSSAQEAQKYLAGGSKEYSVLIDPQLLEQMAADEETELKYIGMLENAAAQLSGMKEELGEENDAVRLGVSFGADGSTTYFAELEKMSEKQRARIEKAREAKKEEAKEAKEKAEAKKAEEAQKEDGVKGTNPYEKNKRVRLYANSAEELLAKIQNVEWNKIKAEENAVGSIIDFGI